MKNTSGNSRLGLFLTISFVLTTLYGVYFTLLPDPNIGHIGLAWIGVIIYLAVWFMNVQFRKDNKKFLLLSLIYWIIVIVFVSCYLLGLVPQLSETPFFTLPYILFTMSFSLISVFKSLFFLIILLVPFLFICYRLAKITVEDKNEIIVGDN